MLDHLSKLLSRESMDEMVVTNRGSRIVNIANIVNRSGRVGDWREICGSSGYGGVHVKEI